VKKFLKTILYIALLCAIFFVGKYIAQSDAVTNYLQNKAEESLPTQFEDKKPFSTFYYDKLTSKQQRAYICIFNSIRSHPDKIQIPSVTFDEVKKIFQYLRYDNPDMFCLNEKCYLITESYKTYFSAEFILSADECEKRSAETVKKAGEIVSEITDKTDSGYEKELYIHDYIVDNCEYKSCDFDSAAYGCIINNEAVCSGYANAAMLMLNLAGIETVVIPGNAQSGDKNEAHLWNMLKLDGEEYFLDVTWDDPDFDKSVSASHLYFNVTEAFISATHSDFDANAVHCVGRKYNYFVYNNLIYDKYDYTITDKMIDYCVKEVTKGNKSVEFMFTPDVFDSAVKKLFGENENDDADIRKIVYYVSASAGDRISSNRVSYVVGDDTKSIRLIFE